MRADHSPGVSPRLDLPDAVRGVIRSFSTDPRPEARVVMQQVLASTDPGAVVDDAELVDAVLAWIAVADAEDPHVSRWADYAAEASRRLHGDEHRQTRRARLACHAVRTGILPKHDNGDQQAPYAISGRITDTSGEAGQDSKRVTDQLIACVALHLRGVCDDVVDELSRTLTTVKDRHDGSSSDLAALIVVLAATLTACRRDQDAYRLLDEHAQILASAGSQSRDLFAECALTLTDLLAAPHQRVCTHHRPADEPAPDRHTLSGLNQVGGRRRCSLTRPGCRCTSCALMEEKDCASRCLSTARVGGPAAETTWAAARRAGCALVYWPGAAEEISTGGGRRRTRASGMVRRPVRP